jgi:hypothetical protein
VIRSHRIRPNETSRVPRRWIVLDTEAEQVQTLTEKTQTFRLAVTSFDRTDTDDHHPIETQWRTHRSPVELWCYIVNHTRRRSRTVVVAHNMAYDLRISDAFTILPQLGWTMTRLAIHERAVNASFRRGDRTLVLADSMSWLPMSLERIGALVDLDKVDLPAFTDSDDEWERRCRRDVEILRAAYLSLVEWVKADDLGNWQKTGAGMAWANWRHRHYSHTVYVHDDERAQAAEVEANYAGRCEAWRHGELDGRAWTEWDLPLAYPRVALDVAVPVNFQGVMTGTSWDKYVRAMSTRRLLVKATVATDVPCLPASQDGRILWPVGKLSGYWWDTELRLAEAEGATIEPTGAYVYTAQPALSEWASWIIEAIESPDSQLTQIQRAAVKVWARALIGRFATRYTVWEDNGPAIDPGVGIHDIADITRDKVGQVLTFGSQSWVGWESTYGQDACVGVMGVIMAEARVRLWQLMRVAGLDHVAYVDTDSIVTDAVGSSRLASHIEAGGGWGLRVKDRWRKLTVLGPRQLVVEGHQRVAGIPKTAELHPSGQWVGETWEGLTAALRAGRPDRVIIRPASWNVRGVDNRRGHLADGSTYALPSTQA